MTIRFDNTIKFDNPADVVWPMLVHIPTVVDCMPGVRLDSVTGGNVFKAVAALKVGPMRLEFFGDGELHDVDKNQYSASLKARGRDRKGRGNFQVDMTFR